jgi:uncharacterized protein (TIGR01777 family)
LRILLSGSSGFIGSEVLSFFQRQGSIVVCLKRGDPDRSTPGHIFWDPEGGRFCLKAFEGFDAVINLAGEPIFGLWTKAKKERILRSRVEGTRLLVKIFTQTIHPPKVFVSASAVGYYGDGGEQWLTESNPVGLGFLASVCLAWETATRPLESRGIRVVNTRFGAVIGREGGILKKMLHPVKLGLGCTLGSGQQWMSWIALQDLVRAIAFCLTTESIVGPINCVSPSPLRQKEFVKRLAKSMARPLFFRFPAYLLRKILGQMADELLLASQRVKPEKLQQHNFPFQLPLFEEAIRQ